VLSNLCRWLNGYIKGNVSSMELFSDDKVCSISCIQHCLWRFLTFDIDTLFIYLESLHYPATMTRTGFNKMLALRTVIQHILIYHTHYPFYRTEFIFCMMRSAFRYLKIVNILFFIFTQVLVYVSHVWWRQRTYVMAQLILD
jgi:hypothetical protein